MQPLRDRLYDGGAFLDNFLILSGEVVKTLLQTQKLGGEAV